jgi:hypothetical protein
VRELGPARLAAHRVGIEQRNQELPPACKEERTIIELHGEHVGRARG